jgi:hypothetical protein
MGVSSPVSRDYVVICFDMWDSLGQRRDYWTRRNGGMQADATVYLAEQAPISDHNRIILEVFKERLCDANPVTGVETEGPVILKLLGDGAILAVPASATAGLRAVEFVVHVIRQFADGDGDAAVATSVAIAAGPISLARAEHSFGYTPLADVFGYPIDIASRLVSVAAPHQLLISNTTAPYLDALGDGQTYSASFGKRNLALRLDPSPKDPKAAWLPVALPGSAKVSTWIDHGVAQVVIDIEAERLTLGADFTSEKPQLCSPIQNRWRRLAALSELVHELRMAKGTHFAGGSGLEGLRLDLTNFCRELKSEAVVVSSHIEAMQGTLRGNLLEWQGCSAITHIRTTPCLARDSSVSVRFTALLEDIERLAKLLTVDGKPVKVDDESIAPSAATHETPSTRLAYAAVVTRSLDTLRTSFTELTRFVTAEVSLNMAESKDEPPLAP